MNLCNTTQRNSTDTSWEGQITQQVYKYESSMDWTGKEREREHRRPDLIQCLIEDGGGVQ